MNQQINLFQPIFRKQKAVFSALAMVQVWVAVALMMGTISAYTAFNVSRLQGQLQQAEQIHRNTKANVEKLKARQLAQTPSKLLEDELKRVRAELNGRRQVAELLGKGPLSNTRGFSSQFEGLARQHVSGAWLTEISLRDGGAWVNLRGVVLQPEIVPAYLNSLLEADAFAPVKFNAVQLQALADATGRVLFEVGTAEKGPGAPLPMASSTAIQGSAGNAVVGITRRAN